jgi:diacylglycerol kinase
MMSIFGAFLTLPAASGAALMQKLDSILVMLLEIMNTSKEVFVCLYISLPLTCYT